MNPLPNSSQTINQSLKQIILTDLRPHVEPVNCGFGETLHFIVGQLQLPNFCTLRWADSRTLTIIGWRRHVTTCAQIMPP